MRVIHHDGRVGSAPLFRAEDAGDRYHYTLVQFCDGSYSDESCWNLRPLGPIESELRSSKVLPEDGGLVSEHWSHETFRVWAGAVLSLRERGPTPARFADVDSEAIEACERIWEQYGVAL